jgi:hypothetical protein
LGVGTPQCMQIAALSSICFPQLEQNIVTDFKSFENILLL